MRRAGRAVLYGVAAGNMVAAAFTAVTSGDWRSGHVAILLAALIGWCIALERRLYRSRREANRMRVRAAAAERSSLELFATGVAFGRRHEYGTPSAPAPETDQQTGMTP